MTVEYMYEMFYKRLAALKVSLDFKGRILGREPPLEEMNIELLDPDQVYLKAATQLIKIGRLSNFRYHLT